MVFSIIWLILIKSQFFLNNFQTFPASERWPFPEYFGACGRHVIVEHVGRMLQDFYNEPFSRRVGYCL
jgi:hypothetical protein